MLATIRDWLHNHGDAAMFYIQGSDGSKLGPVAAGTLRQWLLERRVTDQTLVQREGSEAWQPLASYPEFGQVSEAKPGTLPPPLPGAPPLAPPLPGRPRTSGLAIASLVLALVSPCTLGISALVGMVLGIVARRQIGRSEGRLTGQRLAAIGVALSAVVVVVELVALGFLIPAAERAKNARSTETCVHHLQSVALALRLAAEANEGKFPAAANWCEAALANLQGPELLRCPARSGLRCGFAYNRNVAGRTSSSVPPETILLIESARGWNATAGPEDPLPPPPHAGAYCVAFADGSVREVSSANLPTLRWEP